MLLHMNTVGLLTGAKAETQQERDHEDDDVTAHFAWWVGGIIGSILVRGLQTGRARFAPWRGMGWHKGRRKIGEVVLMWLEVCVSGLMGIVGGASVKINRKQ